jgi:diguanylate cyclase (GGDEF)-like protein
MTGMAVATAEKERICPMEGEANLRFLLRVLQGISVPTFVIDGNHLVTHWNLAMEKLTGLAAKEMVGTSGHWRAFYPVERPLLSDMVVNGYGTETIIKRYDGKCRKSSLIEGAYEVEDYFPSLGEGGKWLFFTASPILDDEGGIIGAVQTFQDATERKLAEEEVRESERRHRELSITDSLTKLYNSRHFFRELRQEMERAKRYDEPLSLIMLDIDNFKGYNDTYGHLEGDRALAVLADVIRGSLRCADTAFRYGGEEFTILLPETVGADAVLVAERLRQSFEDVVLSPAPELQVHMTISLGVGQYCHDEQESAFMKRVDGCMYTAKQHGKNRVYFAG